MLLNNNGFAVELRYVWSDWMGFFHNLHIHIHLNIIIYKR